MTQNLFEEEPLSYVAPQVMAPGAVLLRGFARGVDTALLDAVAQVTAAAPLRHLVTPGGYTMSVAMSNCGALGWVSDRTGYRYTRTDPLSGQPWPAMPACFVDVAVRAAAEAGFDDFRPDACLINRYEPGARLSLHQDRDEGDMSA
ncbi:MAG: alpha-ketoglutarate-dependent dioxygenase AlkB, partial [Polaromonas sp.]